MTFQEDIDSLKDRIAKAESQRDVWRGAGREEKYLEAYFMVESLESPFDERLRRHTADEARC